MTTIKELNDKITILVKKQNDLYILLDECKKNFYTSCRLIYTTKIEAKNSKLAVENSACSSEILKTEFLIKKNLAIKAKSEHKIIKKLYHDILKEHTNIYQLYMDTLAQLSNLQSIGEI